MYPDGMLGFFGISYFDDIQILLVSGRNRIVFIYYFSFFSFKYPSPNMLLLCGFNLIVLIKFILA